MKKQLILLVAAVLSFCAISCTKNVDDNKTENKELSCTANAICEIAEANNEFGFDLFKKLQSDNPNRNLFISPTSLSTVLSMTLNGAENQTKDDMMSTLHNDRMAIEDINSAYEHLLTNLPDLDSKTTLKLANSIWPKLGYEFDDRFLEINSKKYLSEVNPIDFNDPKTISIVNQWIENNTNGLIKDAIQTLPSEVVMLLVNTIYFKGSWKTQFDPKDTYTTDFYSESGTTDKQVDMMYLEEIDLPFFQNDMMKMVDIPYGDSTFSMTVLLPNKNFATDDIIEQLNDGQWKEWMQFMRTRTVELHMPKFKMEFKEMLKNELTSLGMGIAFTGNADFSKMNGTGGLAISDVIHQSFIEVNEEGAEAAAVSVVIIDMTNAEPTSLIKLDRPFVFMIRENQADNILFMGKCAYPEL